MAIKTYNGTAFADATAKYYNGSAWVEPNSGVKRWNGSVWEVVSTAFEATLTQTTLSGSSSYNSTLGSYTGETSSPGTGYTAVTVTGGKEPFTYQWFYISGTVSSINLFPQLPTQYTTRFGFNYALQGGNAVYRCQVTDDDGNVINTDTVTVSFS
jgi:hypothetical protein